ncbi:MAG: DUF1846 domain-containing protein [Bacilli bacterium]|nr:DUF1846 domain-containing protein [Bacilli bacterium]
MVAVGFDNDRYVSIQTERIKERIAAFGGKLYLEFGGKLFDDFHASRVLPGFKPDTKLQMLLEMKDQAEIIIVINSQMIEDAKVREDIGITYDQDVLRLMDAFHEAGLYVGSVCLTQYANQKNVKPFERYLAKLGVKTYRHYAIPNYPYDVDHIVSKDGLGKNDYIETSRSLVVVTAPGPGSGKMATCLSQMYHDAQRGVKSGYAKFETFPIWNLPLKHPVNLAYEAATADLDDVNMIDPYHLEQYGVSTVSYNRDIEIFPVLNRLISAIFGESPYHSPTDMGVNMGGFCISDDEVCKQASRQEIIRRYYKALMDVRKGRPFESSVAKIENLMNNNDISIAERRCVAPCVEKAKATGAPASAIELNDGQIITGKTSSLLGATAAMILNALKTLAGISDKVALLPKAIIEPICYLKIKGLGHHNPRLHVDDVLMALSISAVTNPVAELALNALPLLRGCESHSSVILSSRDMGTLNRLGIRHTCEPFYEKKKLYHSK